jgi:hypothetical protein
MYNAERREMLERVGRDHDMGLHGEGEDRRSFTDPYPVNEFMLMCQKCQDELASEDLGVRPDQVQLATWVKNRIDEAAQDLENAKTSFMKYWEAGNIPLAIEHYGQIIIESTYVYELWAKVASPMEGYDRETGTSFELNLADRYLKIVEGLTEQLVGDSFRDDYKRHEASKFIREGRYYR